MAEPDRRFTPWITYLLVAANLAMFVVELASGASPTSPSPQQMIDLGGNFAPLTLHGEPWRLVSSMFLHYGVLHIGLNMLCLYQARVVEQIYGRAGFSSIYLVAGLLGGVASMARASSGVSAGASGAVFGVYGAFAAFLVVRKATMAPEAWQSTARSIGTFVAINLVFGFATPGIDMSAHIGGLVVGFGVGAALLAGRSSLAQRTARALGLAVAGVAVTGASLFVIHAPADITPALEAFDRVQAASIGKYQALLARNQSGGVPDAEAADEIEREVLAPWQAMRKQLDRAGEPPARLAPMFAVLKRYVASRQQAWETAVAGLRTTGAAQEQRLADYQRQEAVAAEDFAALERALAALK